MNRDAPRSQYRPVAGGYFSLQLESEIDEGSWFVYDVPLQKFLKNWDEPKLHDIKSIKSYLESESI